jgi:hypothetical protein
MELITADETVDQRQRRLRLLRLLDRLSLIFLRSVAVTPGIPNAVDDYLSSSHVVITENGEVLFDSRSSQTSGCNHSTHYVDECPDMPSPTRRQ